MNPYYSKVCGYDFERFNGHFFIPAGSHNLIVKVKDCGETDIVYYDSRFKFSHPGMWGKVARIGTTIAFAPLYNNEIVLVDAISGSVIWTGRIEGEADGTRLFWQVISSENAFYFMGFQYPGIIRLDAITHELSCICEWVSTLFQETEFDGVNDFYLGDGYAHFESEFYFPVGEGGYLLKLDCVTDRVELVSIDEKRRSFYSVAQNGDCIWCLNIESGEIVIWDRISHKTKVITPREGEQWNTPVFYENHVFLFPLKSGGEILRGSLVNLTFNVFNPLNDLLIDDGQRKYDVMCAKKEGKYIIINRTPDCKWFAYDLVTGELTSKEVSISDLELLKKLRQEHYDDVFEKSSSEKHFLKEAEIPLEEYINRI